MTTPSSTSLLLIVPTLNSYEVLSRLVDSLLAQTWSNWRVLFVDGSSCAKHREWLDRCCDGDARFKYVVQDPLQPGIFGAMNQGLLAAKPSDWVLFWGSDDMVSSADAVAGLINYISSFNSQASSIQSLPDLLVCRGRYFNSSSQLLTRPAIFDSSRILDACGFRRALMFGSTPPHQATLFGPGSFAKVATYSPYFRLSADLDYFLRLSDFQDLSVHCLDLELVHISEGGVSGQQTLRRLTEVRRAYINAFGFLWFFVFIMRYLGRLVILMRWSR